MEDTMEEQWRDEKRSTRGLGTMIESTEVAGESEDFKIKLSGVLNTSGDNENENMKQVKVEKKTTIYHKIRQHEMWTDNVEGSEPENEKKRKGI
ncbi:Uncharacterized protein TCM_026231 [Theobroma cacao]|uniref:Uncharacterized protein n=1 Tax=Theobroma cacao TaxID=3641 RepID=A0A061F1N2_THECC|nr:Uncharacterized protein TCM_026231 [Theobroma cacao]